MYTVEGAEQVSLYHGRRGVRKAGRALTRGAFTRYNLPIRKPGAPAPPKEERTLGKALKSIGLMGLIALVSLVSVGWMFHGGVRKADADPNVLLARELLPYLRDGQTFRLSDAYPDPWDAVQVVRNGERLPPWTWRTLCAFDAALAQVDAGVQLLVFWQDGAVARAVRLWQGAAGMPWFQGNWPLEESVILPREAAVFRATFQGNGHSAYYACEPSPDGTPV